MLYYDSMLPVVFGDQKNFMIVPSETDKEKKYRIYLDRHGALRCNCADNIFRSKKMCKHLNKYIGGTHET